MWDHRATPGHRHDEVPVDDEQLTRYALAAGRGDPDAATAFVRATQRDVTWFLARLSGGRDVEDLAQETYLRAFGSLSRFAGRSSARTWLLAIARRVAVDHVRRAMTRPRLAPLGDWQVALDELAAVEGPRMDEDTVLRDLLTGLMPERRAAFVTTQLLGLSYIEAAQVCDCPVGTIRSRVARAREDLIAALTANERRPTPLPHPRTVPTIRTIVAS